MLAVQAGVGEPLDADTVAELDALVLGVCADGNNDTDTLCRRDVLAPRIRNSASEYVPRVHR